MTPEVAAALSADEPAGDAAPSMGGRTGATAPSAGAPAGAAARLRALVQEAGGRLAPLHPDTADGRLAAYYVADVPESAARDLVARLRALPEAVEDAFAKTDAIPADAPPEQD